MLRSQCTALQDLGEVSTTVSFHPMGIDLQFLLESQGSQGVPHGCVCHDS